MENKAFKKSLSLYTSLLELHEENPFKIRNLSSKIFNLDRLGVKLDAEPKEKMEGHPGIGKKLAEAIVSIRDTGSFKELDELLSETPEGVVTMLGIKGIGAKKVRTIWKELGVDTIEDLYKAGQDGVIAKLPGFGEKTQKTILEGLDYKKEQEGKGLYGDWLVFAEKFEELLGSQGICSSLQRIGPLAWGDDILESMDWMVDKKAFSQLKTGKVKELEIEEKLSGPFSLRGKLFGEIPVCIKTESTDRLGNTGFLLSSPPGFVGRAQSEKPELKSLLEEKKFSAEKEVFTEMGIGFISPELRWVADITDPNKSPEEIIKTEDVKGVLHAHSTYSDGQNSIEEMVKASIEKGYSYFGLSDHSKSAFYANGLDEDRVIQQHKEVDEVSKSYPDFKIFKGIESDILNDGSLDYSDEVLSSFDFIVASVHSNLNMDISKATDRLIKAVENPYTTILGHPTGRLLLRREGYPIDHRSVIDACAANGVIIEINANPWRLDLDWKWIPYAQEKGVLISINPDAHEINGIDDIAFGVMVGRKGGLRKENTFNAMMASEVEDYFNKRKP